MQLDNLQDRYRDAAERIHARAPFDAVGRAARVLRDARGGVGRDIPTVIAAARFLIFMFYSDLTGRYTPPTESDDYTDVISDAVLSVVPAGEVLGPVEAAKLLETQRQNLPLWTRSWAYLRHFTPLWRNGRRVYLRAELVAARAGEEPPYGATV